jgi:hypothetical protein
LVRAALESASAALELAHKATEVIANGPAAV